MKTFNQYIIAALFFIQALSCSNDFLSETADISSSLSSTTELLISPEWGSIDFSINIPMANNAKFNIIKTPEWLLVNNLSGQFVNGIATINCKASVHRDFSEIGIYKDLMVLDIEGKGKSLVPVSYITEGNPMIETEKNITVSFNYGYIGYYDMEIKNKGKGILLVTFTEQPEWINLSWLGPNQGFMTDKTMIPIPANSSITLSISFNIESIASSDLSGKIVIASNDKNNKETTININCDLGNPLLYCSSNQLNFRRTETKQTMDISNQSSGLLLWKVESCPEWLSVSETEGALIPHSWKTLTFTCDRNLLPPGQQSHTIYFKTNDKNNPSYAITVTAYNNITNPENIRAIQGIVTDAWMDKTTDILYLSTSQPNRLLAYNIKTKTIDKELTLSKAPTCFSISEDGRQAIIGHGGMISVVDIYNFSVSKNVEVDNIVYDIEWGNDGWCCYTETNVQWSSLYWVNLNTNEKSKYSGLYGGCILNKIPNQNYLIAAEVNLSSGIYIFDLDTREKKYNIFTSLGNHWFSENGTYLFSGKNIYRTSSLFKEEYFYEISPIGIFSPNPYRTFWIDHNAASKSVWILSSSTDYYFDTQREIQQYEDNDYIRIKTYYYDDFYKDSPAQAQYVFSNSNGNEVIVIKNNNQNEWAVEHIPVSK